MRILEKRKESDSDYHSIFSSRWGDFSSDQSRSASNSFGEKSASYCISKGTCNPFKYKRRRVMDKNGQLNISRKNFTSEHQRKFLRDIFYTLVDSKWRFTFITFTVWYIISWSLFAFIWFMISTVHGDLNEDHLPSVQGEYFNISCISYSHKATF